MEQLIYSKELLYEIFYPPIIYNFFERPSYERCKDLIYECYITDERKIKGTISTRGNSSVDRRALLVGGDGSLKLAHYEPGHRCLIEFTSSPLEIHMNKIINDFTVNFTYTNFEYDRMPTVRSGILYREKGRHIVRGMRICDVSYDYVFKELLTGDVISGEVDFVFSEDDEPERTRIVPGVYSFIPSGGLASISLETDISKTYYLSKYV